MHFSRRDSRPSFQNAVNPALTFEKVRWTSFTFNLRLFLTSFKKKRSKKTLKRSVDSPSLKQNSLCPESVWWKLFHHSRYIERRAQWGACARVVSPSSRNNRRRRSDEFVEPITSSSKFPAFALIPDLFWAKHYFVQKKQRLKEHEKRFFFLFSFFTLKT